MRRALTLLCGFVLLTGAIGGAIGCDRPTQDECDEACSRVKALAKADFDQRTKDLPEDVTREGWLSAMGVIDELVGACSSACMDVGDRKLTTCLAGAADPAAWRACLEKK